MDKKDIEEIIAIADKWDLDELEIEKKESRIRVVRRNKSFQVMAMPAAAPQPTSAAASSAPSAAAGNDIPAGLHPVRSPMLGIFLNPDPAEGGTVANVGDTIAAGQGLGFVEAMKMRTEIVSDIAGELVEVLAADQQAVEFNHPLFLLRPNKE